MAKMPNLSQKSRGFEGELIIEPPKTAIAQSQRQPLIHTCFIARMGYYPKALHHYFNRTKGITHVILLFCADGRGWIQYEDKKVSLEAGEVHVIPAGTPHSYGADVNNPWTIYWFHFSGSHCHESIWAILGDRDKIKVSFSDERNAIFRQIAATFLKGYSAANLLFANLMLRQYIATFVFPEQFSPDSSAKIPISPTEKSILFMQQNLSKPLTLKSIAESVNLSVSFLSGKFKQQTGYAPIEYFNYLRVQKACQLLHFSELRISEVASQIGMDDPLYFSRLFKKQMGLSPLQYRRNEISAFPAQPKP
ncbi:AraC family transcriptional regulator [Spirosoma areae]